MMRERVKVSDLTTLFVCPSSNWGTLERRAIADSVFFRDIGGNSIIFCLKDSYIDYEARLQDIPTIYYTGTKVNKFFDLSYFIDLRNIFNENRFDIIHCYDLNYVWKISFLLMANSKIPLFLSLNSFINKRYTNLIHRWLFKRIDHLITYSKATKEIVIDNLPITNRKIKIVGAGVEGKNKRIKNETPIRTIGCFINKGGDSYRKIRPILYSIKPLVEVVKSYDFQLKFVFFSEDDWKDLKDFEKIEETISDLEISDLLSFETVHNRELAIQRLDLFIGTEFDEPFNDFEVMALMYSIPVVVPRTASRQELLSNKMFIGESYYSQDARELKAKILKILENEKVYLSEITINNEKICELHGVEFYTERLLDLYERSFTKRLRVSKKIQNSSDSSLGK